MSDTAIFAIVSGDPKNAGKLVRGIERAVQRSYDSDLIRDGAGKVIATRDEIKRRTQLCIDAAALLRRELKWSIDRIVDELPKMLRQRLDGSDWNPEEIRARSSWFSG